MSESFATYSRDQNVEGPINSASFVPEYDSVVSFEYPNSYFKGGDNHDIKFTKGLNGTNMSMALRFSQKTEDEAKSFLHLFEEVLLSETGNLDFDTVSSSGVEISFPTGIYKSLSGFIIQDYSFNLHNGLFDIDLNLQKNTHSYFFDWKGSSYLSTGDLETGWEPGKTYEKYDIVYFPEYQTGGNPYAVLNVNRIEKFYYCNSGHISEYGNNPTGASSAWTRSFFYEPDDDVSISSDFSEFNYSLKNSFSAYNKTKRNQGLLKDLKISLKNRSDKETKSIIHFIEKHENSRPFEINIPQLYTKKKFFIAKSLKHTFVYRDCNDIELTVDEVLRYKEEFFLNSFYYDN